jgi:hypothetical protein
MSQRVLAPRLVVRPQKSPNGVRLSWRGAVFWTTAGAGTGT